MFKEREEGAQPGPLRHSLINTQPSPHHLQLTQKQQQRSQQTRNWSIRITTSRRFKRWTLSTLTDVAESPRPRHELEFWRNWRIGEPCRDISLGLRVTMGRIMTGFLDGGSCTSVLALALALVHLLGPRRGNERNLSSCHVRLEATFLVV